MFTRGGSKRNTRDLMMLVKNYMISNTQFTFLDRGYDNWLRLERIATRHLAPTHSKDNAGGVSLSLEIVNKNDRKIIGKFGNAHETSSALFTLRCLPILGVQSPPEISDSFPS